MNDIPMNAGKPVNQKRRTLLQGAAIVGAAGFAPAALSKAPASNSEPNLSGKLICKLSDPVKTLILRNHSNQTMLVNQIVNGAFMFDGGILDCNAACVTKPISIQPNQEIEVRFKKRQQFSLTHSVSEYNRIQTRVTRLNDGTRVIPFSATMYRNVASII